MMIGICSKCREEKPINVPNERRRIHHGPNNERLCKQHYRQAMSNRRDCPTCGAIEPEGATVELPLPDDDTGNKYIEGLVCHNCGTVFAKNEYQG